jgi:magnesium chelatase family protein
LAPRSLIQLANHFKGTQVMARPEPAIAAANGGLPDLKDIKGQESGKRALEIAAAGGHNLLMSGPPGAGKSMLAQRLPSILPPLAPRELLEVSMIQSVAGHLADGALSSRRPFRAPHHSASMAALVGGGLNARRARCRSPIMGCSSSTSCPSSSPRCSTPCASRWRAARS